MNKNEILVYCRLKTDGFTESSIAAVMGVVGGESAFQYLVEFSYLTTDNSALRNIFSAFSGQSDAYINQCKQSDYTFFNCVYGGQGGNSTTEGYKYRGRGFNGITFKGNYESIQRGISLQYDTNVDLVNNPELLERPDIAAKALSYYFRMVKGINDFETAFQEAYRQNAGPANSFAVYAASTNAVHVGGIPRKRAAGLKYLDAIRKGAFLNKCDGTQLGASGLLLGFPIVFFLTLGGYYLYKK
ncbi:hypothetical protein EB077_12090, partial [bacterium]|nr:hypothetical protein [bacterium]